MLSPARSPDALAECRLSPVSAPSVAGLTDRRCLTGGCQAEVREAVLTGCQADLREAVLTRGCQAEVREAVLTGDLPRLEHVLRLHEPAALTCTTCDTSRRPLNVNVFHPRSGQTPLHLAILQGDLGLVDLLIRCGANQWLANKDGWPPLHVALWSGCPSVTARLLRPPPPQPPQPVKSPTGGRPFVLQQHQHEHFNMPPTPPASPPAAEDLPPLTPPSPVHHPTTPSPPLHVKAEPASPPRSPAQCRNPLPLAEKCRNTQISVSVKPEHVDVEEAATVRVKAEPMEEEEWA